MSFFKEFIGNVPKMIPRHEGQNFLKSIPNPLLTAWDGVLLGSPEEPKASKMEPKVPKCPPEDPKIKVSETKTDPIICATMGTGIILASSYNSSL